MIPKATQIRLDPETRSELESWLRASTTEQRMTRRARIILLAAEGKGSRAIARETAARGQHVAVALCCPRHREPQGQAAAGRQTGLY
jgi:hypothetical protein